MFPDAPTLRGIKHLEELIAVRKAGMEAYLLFVIQMKEITKFRPCCERHPAFAQALQRAVEHGVSVLAMDCEITPDSMTISQPVPVQLQ
jgi:sugar fermentation stimulation protein A